MTPRSDTRRPLIVARGQARCALSLLLAFSVLSGGCATGESTVTPNRPQMSDGNARTPWGSVGVATTTLSPILSPHRPETPIAAAKSGAEIGVIPLALADLKLSMLSEDDMEDEWAQNYASLVMVLGVALSLITGSVGAIYGALAGKSSEDTKTAVSNLDMAIRGGNVQQRLRDIVIARLSREYDAVVPVNDTATAHEAIGTVVEARVNFVYLDAGGSQPNPKLRLSLVGDMRIHRNGKVVNVTRIGSSGAGRHYTLADWAAHNARRFKRGMVRELASLADDTARKLLAWRIVNDPSPAALEPLDAICPKTSPWERLGLDLVCPSAVTSVSMTR